MATSEMFRDRLENPMQTAIFWIEHVIETKGAPHLQSRAAHYQTYLYYNFDVWTFYALVIIFMLFVLRKAISFIIRKIKIARLKFKLA